MCHLGAWENGNEDVLRTEGGQVPARIATQIASIGARLQIIEARIERLEAKTAYNRRVMFLLIALCVINLASHFWK